MKLSCEVHIVSNYGQQTKKKKKKTDPMENKPQNTKFSSNISCPRKERAGNKATRLEILQQLLEWSLEHLSGFEKNSEPFLGNPLLSQYSHIRGRPASTAGKLTIWISMLMLRVLENEGPRSSEKGCLHTSCCEQLCHVHGWYQVAMGHEKEEEYVKLTTFASHQCS